jgi:hypothetical protein
MVVPPGSGGRQGLLEQLLVLPPTVKLVAGAFMLLLGVVGMCMMPSVYSFVLLGLGVALGVPLLLAGRSERRQQGLDAVERLRAEGELAELRLAITAAVERKHNVGRILRERGYSSARVRRWIALECGIVLAQGRLDA